MAKECRACGGVYEPMGADGVAYYHACPPIVKVPVLRGGASRLVDLGSARPDDVVVVRRGDRKVRIPVQDAQPDDVRLGDVHEERPDRRDETIVASIVRDVVVGVPKREGAGAREVVVGPPDPFTVFDDAPPP